MGKIVGLAWSGQCRRSERLGRLEFLLKPFSEGSNQHHAWFDNFLAGKAENVQNVFRTGTAAGQSRITLSWVNGHGLGASDVWLCVKISGPHSVSRAFPL